MLKCGLLKITKIMNDNQEKELHELVSEQLVEIIKDGDARIRRIDDEFADGFNHIRKYPKSVTIFGSARLPEDDPHYQAARKLGKMLVEAGFAVITGGGPGIMEAGNRGAKEGGGPSIGFNIELPFEQSVNDYVTESHEFHYFFTRKVVMTYAAEAYVYFPGGFGTLDEFFEVITLIQTKKVPAVPVFCIGTDFWNPIQDTLRAVLSDKFATINPEDLNLYTITDDLDMVVEKIKQAPIRLS